MTILDPTVELKNMRQQHYDDTAEKFQRSVKLILMNGKDKEDKPDVVGSGVLLTIDGDYYLVSAAHVFDQPKDSIVYTSNDGKNLIPIALNGFHSPPDKFDFGVCNLNTAQVKALGAENFISEDLIAAMKTSTDNHCMGLGFPRSKNKVSFSSKTVKGKLYRYITQAIRKVENFSFFNYGDVLHTETMAFVKPPDPNGMSGGLLVDVGPLTGWEQILKAGHDKIVRPRALGIIIEKVDNKMDDTAITEIKAVDLNLIRDAIRQKKAEKVKAVDG